MIQQDKYIKHYTDNFKIFEENLNGQKNGHIHDLRKAAILYLQDCGFPTTHEEEWRFTNIDPLLAQLFSVTSTEKQVKLQKKDIEHLLYKDWSGLQLVFVDGIYKPDLSDLDWNQSGIIMSSLNAIHGPDQDVLLETFAGYETFKQNAFSALNTAFIRDGVVLKLEKNIIAEEPIHLLHIATENDKGQLINPRNLIYLSEGSQAILVESHLCLGSGKYFNNPVTEIRLNENAHLNHIRLQNESENAYHIGSVFVDQKQNSNYTSTSMSFGAKISRHNTYTKLGGQGIETILNGLYMGHGDQLVDNNTFIDHLQPHCESHELFRGVLSDNAHGVFSGKIMVHPDAQKTDAKQSNNCLLLSDNAQINSKPQLEIYADDVRCTHGATVGQLDEEGIFYLRSRGISEQQAKNILTYAFAEQVIEGIEIEAVRDYVDLIILSRLKEDMNFIK